MLALTDESLARLLIAATAIAPAEREGMAYAICRAGRATENL